jgi:hypothetical protein
VIRPVKPLYQGRIIYARDTSGRGKYKRRPMIVASTFQDIAKQKKFSAVVISTQFGDPLADNEILLPSGPEVNASTFLGKECVAVWDWIEMIEVDKIEGDKGGVVPGSLLILL